MTEVIEQKSPPKRPQPPNTKIYVVQPTDTLMGVAIKFNMNVSEITKLNRIWNSQFFPGLKLYVKDNNVETDLLEKNLKEKSNLSEHATENPKEILNQPPRNFEDVNDGDEAMRERIYGDHKPKIDEKKTQSLEELVLQSESSKKQELDDSQKDNEESKLSVSPVMSPLSIFLNEKLSDSWISPEDIIYQENCSLRTENGLIPGVLLASNTRISFEQRNEDGVPEDNLSQYEFELHDIVTAKHLPFNHSPSNPEIENEEEICVLQIIVKKETGIFLNNVVTEEFDFELPKDHVRPILEIIAGFEPPPKEFLSRRSSLKEIFMNVGKSVLGEKEIGRRKSAPTILSRVEALESHESSLDRIYFPTLDHPSRFLTNENIEAIMKHIPSRHIFHDWTLIYSTFVHGISLQTFYSRMSAYEGPSIFVTVDRDEFKFGAYASESFHVNPTYYGTGESFLFQLEPKVVFYPWTQENSFFQFGCLESLGFGGGKDGQFGLWFDSDFDHGCSQYCETFGNPCLSGKQDFVAKGLEVWGFTSSGLNNSP